MSEAHLEMHANEVMESVLKFNSQAAVTDEDHLPHFCTPARGSASSSLIWASETSDFNSSFISLIVMVYLT